MKIHPICEVFPAMQPDEQKALVQSMVANGYDTDQPVVMFEKMILDGRHRHNAAEEAGVKAVYVEFKGDMDDAVRFVEQRNLRRRHLTVGQRAMVAAGLESYHKADAQERQRGGVRADPPEGSGRALDAAAKAAGSTRRRAQAAKRIAKADPKLAESVKQGKVSLNKAEDEVRSKAPPRPSKAPERPCVPCGTPGEAPPRPEKPKDEAGRAIPPKAAEAIARTREFKDLEREVHEIKRKVLALAKEPIGHNLNAQSLEKLFREICTAIDWARPYTACPLNETCTSKCKACHGLNWINADVWKNAPKEFKK